MIKKLVIIGLLFFSSSLYAANCDLLYVASGINNVLRIHSQSTEFRVEYKSHLQWWRINPLVGVSVTTKEQVYAYGGFALEFIPGDCFVIAPNFAAGYYNKGKGKDLGFPLEFRTGIELAARLKNKIRLGLHFSHTSNASLGHKNPGLEALVFFIAIPLKKY